MSKRLSKNLIRLRGVRQNNLKNFDLDLPTGKLIVVTGLSGSGKSSLAFDTLYAEGQRRYIETFSPYARQFFDRMDRPQVDSIQGIPPAIAIEQRNAVKTTRSTVGTMTELCDYMKVVWPHVAQLHCRGCNCPVQKDPPGQIWDNLTASLPQSPPVEVLLTFDLPLSDKLSLDDSLALVANQGYQRILLRPNASSPSPPSPAAPQIVRIDDLSPQWKVQPPQFLTVLQDRLKVVASSRSRFVDASEQAYHFGHGKLSVWPLDSNLSPQREMKFSQSLHCAACDIEYGPPSAALFSFNHPLGACPSCRGFGRTISIDYNLAIPDPSLSLQDGAVKPWNSATGLESKNDLLKYCKKRKVPVDIPFADLPAALQRWVIEGDPDYGKDAAHEWPRAWYGIKGYFKWLESRAYKMHVRVLLSRYRAYIPCADCDGKRLQKDALLYRVVDPSGRSITLADFYQLPVRDALNFINETSTRLGPSRSRSDPLLLALEQVRCRLAFLNDVGLGYLTLDRPTRTLSGGETERVNLTTCLGSHLVNTLFVLDEPTVGLHPRDTHRLIRIMQQLRDTGNTVLVVEHDPSVMRAADQIIDLGPGQGATGGHVVFQGPFEQIVKSASSLTGQFLGGHRSSPPSQCRPINDSTPKLYVKHASIHNLKDLHVEIPLQRFVCITGVSGSGKSTLMRDVLFPFLQAKLASRSRSRISTIAALHDKEVPSAGPPDDSDSTLPPGIVLHGSEHLDRAVLVDQSAVGKTPRSNPAVYIGAFDPIRQLFARAPAAQQRGLTSSSFSFNSAEGQCELCRGAGFEKIEMQFLSDVYIRCPQCLGRRYRNHILEIQLAQSVPMPPALEPISWNIAQLLDAPVDEAVKFLEGFPEDRSARAARSSLQLLQQVGLGYLRLGQPVNTLSGGESQRLKLVSHLAQLTEANHSERILFLFDEPTTGLHFHDVEVLVRVFQTLVNAGHSVLVIEHNLDLIHSADWIIDLGPDAGAEGGRLVAQGTPKQIAASPLSHTGRALSSQRHGYLS